MKKLIILFIGLIFIPVLIKAQQISESKKRDNSITFAYAPTYFTLFDDKLFFDDFWPPSFYLTSNFSLNERLSFSTGVHIIFKKHVGSGLLIDNGFSAAYSGHIKSTNKISYYGIPLRLNYYILKPNQKFNLYAKTEITNALKVNYEKWAPDTNGKFYTHSDTGYNMFLGLGVGVDFKVNERFSTVIEPGLNFSVLGVTPNVGLFDCQLGIKYALSKK